MRTERIRTLRMFGTSVPITGQRSGHGRSTRMSQGRPDGPAASGRASRPPRPRRSEPPPDQLSRPASRNGAGTGRCRPAGDGVLRLDAALALPTASKSRSEPPGTSPVTCPAYDPRAPVAGRRRAVVVVGGAAAVAFLVAGASLSTRATATAPHRWPATVEPAGELTARAERGAGRNRVERGPGPGQPGPGGRSALRGRVFRGGKAANARATTSPRRAKRTASTSSWRRSAMHAEAARAALASLAP